MTMRAQKSLWHGRVIRYVPLVLSAALILTLSMNDASHAQTSRFIRPVLEFLFPNSTVETLEYYHVIVRKTAHLTEYGFLAFFAARAFFYSSKENLSRMWPIAAISIVVFVAVIDETNQSFNSARTGSVIDVSIDFAGGVLGIFGFYLMLQFWRKIFKQKS